MCSKLNSFETSELEEVYSKSKIGNLSRKFVLTCDEVDRGTVPNTKCILSYVEWQKPLGHPIPMGEVFWLWNWKKKKKSEPFRDFCGEVSSGSVPNMEPIQTLLLLFPSSGHSPPPGVNSYKDERTQKQHNKLKKKLEAQKHMKGENNHILHSTPPLSPRKGKYLCHLNVTSS